LRLLLDTVTFIWSSISPELLSKKAVAAIGNEHAIREVSTISLSEIAIKQTRGKLSFRKNDPLAGLTALRARVLPYTADHAFELFNLPTHHSDPFDRQIIAQALCENIPVVTSDEKFRLYDGLTVIW